MLDKRSTKTPITLGEHGEIRIAALARAAGIASQIDVAQRIFRLMMAPWGEARVESAPPWQSDASDDHTPYELSITVSKSAPEVRVLVDKRGDPPTLGSNQIESRALNETLARDWGVSLDRLRRIEDLFSNRDPAEPFAFWHAVSFQPDRPPSFKIYVNLNAHGVANAPALAETALARLGFPRAWPVLAERAMRRGPALDAPLYFSLDLSPSKDARVKVYVRHHQASIEDLERAGSAARIYSPGRITEFCTAMAGEGPYLLKGPATCLSLVEGEGDQPVATTTYLPIGVYTTDDRAARDRILAYLGRHGLPTNAYLSALEAIAHRPLEAGSEMHSYASLRWTDEPRVTVYFGPEAYRVAPPRAALASPRVRTVASAIEIVHHHEATPVTAHPLFARLRREPVSLERMWRILANLREAVVLHFPRRLASLTARVEDDRVRCLLAKQLNDELGDGDFSRAHRGLFERMIEGLAPWRPADFTEESADPGREFGRELERLYVTADPDEGVGASFVVEIGGKQVDTFIAEEFRRQHAVAPETLTWLHLHEELEVEHVDEAMSLAKLAPASGPRLEAMRRGAQAVADAAWRFFDAMYRQCYS